MRIILCGSAFTVMRGLLAGSALSHPLEARLVGRGRARVWEQANDTAESLIFGPHLEDLARSRCVDHAAPETLGGLPSRCEPALIACREHKMNHELDVVVSADPPQQGTGYSLSAR